ncbi:ClpXP protease specificity-enhancing factor SspB [Nitrospirota bacterium]
MNELADIKKDLFFRLLDGAGRVFVHVLPSMELEIGRRGLVGDELENGITLVFNSHMKFDWGDYGIEVTLVFGSTPEKCFIPTDAIDAIYSPELKVQLLMEQTDDVSKPRDSKSAQPKEKAAEVTGTVSKSEGKVIEVDFHKKKDN